MYKTTGPARSTRWSSHHLCAPYSTGTSQPRSLPGSTTTAQSMTADTLETVPATSATAAVMPSNDASNSGPIKVTDVVTKAIIKCVKHLVV